MQRPKKIIKRISSTGLITSILAIKAIETTLPALIADQKDPSLLLEALVYAVGLLR